MKSIYIRGGKAKNTAVNILVQHLTGLGHRVVRNTLEPHDVVLCWGCSYDGNKPVINARVNEFDKLDCFTRFNKAKVRCPLIISQDRANQAEGELDYQGLPNFPWLARKRHHVKGKDIVVCTDHHQVYDTLLTHDFYSVFIPTQTEYRVWVFQDKVFGIYEKVYKGEGEYEGFMRNRRFGFKFEKRDNLRGMKEIEVPCIKAVKALNMDFGAVDVILGKDGKIYVLEVNSMPHIDSPKRSMGIRLTNLISDWAENVN